MRLVWVSPGAAGAASVLSLGGLAFATLEGWPIWARGLATVLPWLPLFVRSLAHVYRDYQWLALFYALVVTQTAHLLEHVTQMVQIHFLGLGGPGARGIFGALDIEWVHFVWNSWVLLAVLALLVPFRRNRWLQIGWPCILITASARAAASAVGRDRPMWPGSARPCISPGRHVLPATTRTVAGATKPASARLGHGGVLHLRRDDGQTAGLCRH